MEEKIPVLVCVRVPVVYSSSKTPQPHSISSSSLHQPTLSSIRYPISNLYSYPSGQQRTRDTSEVNGLQVCAVSAIASGGGIQTAEFYSRRMTGMRGKDARREIALVHRPLRLTNAVPHYINKMIMAEHASAYGKFMKTKLVAGTSY
ncbi:hypothetical protein EVAR_48363_1 [Eumeta japonica]|uniref:Uncharacterized protein n=1 Tax=Eumeta variegata TaxID=151549 RepID=A0A4C1WK93_EUMVA|nr:hypothetical protein EVAR_48363_1 [Eumeta japonica]